MNCKSESQSRIDLALSMKSEGRTLKEIGSALGVSSGRARQIIAKAARVIRERKELSERISGGDLLALLSVRTRNCLEVEGISQGELLSMTEHQLTMLLKIPNFGKKCLEEVEHLIRSHSNGTSETNPET